MNILEAAQLIKPAVPGSSENSVWADLGCGTGTFTNALATLLGAGSKVYAIDKESKLQLSAQTIGIEITFIKVNVELEPLPVSNLDGILLANVLHYIKDQLGFIKRIREDLKSDGKIILVEYDRESSNQWVPFPVSQKKAKTIFSSCGFGAIEKIGERNSVYGRDKMYACSINR